MIKMDNLQDNFLSGSGFSYDIEEVIKSLETKEEKITFFKKIAWQMPGGMININGRRGEAIANALNEIANELGLSIPDIDNDGIITDDEKNIELKVKSFDNSANIENEVE